MKNFRIFCRNFGIDFLKRPKMIIFSCQKLCIELWVSGARSAPEKLTKNCRAIKKTLPANAFCSSARSYPTQCTVSSESSNPILSAGTVSAFSVNRAIGFEIENPNTPFGFVTQPTGRATLVVVVMPARSEQNVMLQTQAGRHEPALLVPARHSVDGGHGPEV